MTFTQFLFPDGRRTTVTIDRSADIETKAKALATHGFVFEIENNDGVIWATCINHKLDLSADEWCPNGPLVNSMVNALVEKAYDQFIKRASRS